LFNASGTIAVSSSFSSRDAADEYEEDADEVIEQDEIELALNNRLNRFIRLVLLLLFMFSDFLSSAFLLRE
jgi:hypothetical protein